MMLGDTEEAIAFLRKGRAGNPRLFYIHMLLAAALGLKGELNEAAAALRHAIETPTGDRVVRRHPCPI